MHSLKYLRSTTLGYKDIEIYKSEFVTLFLYLLCLPLRFGYIYIIHGLDFYNDERLKKSYIANNCHLCEHLQNFEPDSDIFCALSHCTPRLTNKLLCVQPISINSKIKVLSNQICVNKKYVVWINLNIWFG